MSKRKATTTTDAFEEQAATPSYGTKEYWDSRYANHTNEEKITQQKDCDTKNTIEDEPEAHHAWYFTYEELSPLILPLIEHCNDYDKKNQGNNSTDDENAGGGVTVLEIGCGDVPMGPDLLAEAGAKLRQIICCDYSSVCIDALLHHHALDNKNPNDDKLQYTTADARKMPQYADRSMDVILDKGTLDAMLSDEKDGKRNSIAIVQECARVLRIGSGGMLIVSHLNANNIKGMDWLQSVVFEGLGNCMKMDGIVRGLLDDEPDKNDVHDLLLVAKGNDGLQEGKVKVKVDEHEDHHHEGQSNRLLLYRWDVECHGGSSSSSDDCEEVIIEIDDAEYAAVELEMQSNGINCEEDKEEEGEVEDNGHNNDETDSEVDNSGPAVYIIRKLAVREDGDNEDHGGNSTDDDDDEANEDGHKAAISLNFFTY